MALRTNFNANNARMRPPLDPSQTPLVEGDNFSHPIVGELNPSAWASGYRLWSAEGGAWELATPLLSTHRKGGVLNNIISPPGAEVPGRFPAEALDEVEEEIWEMGRLLWR